MFRGWGLGAVILAAVLPLTARAAWGPVGSGFCGHCQLPFTSCGCAQPVCGGCQMTPGNCQCGAVPRAQTVQSTVMQPVVRTEMRPQTTLVNVPVQVSRQVTVDEGGYQSVWVPKLVSKSVTETVMRQELRVSSVPVQVVQQVPVTQTRIVMQPDCQHGMAAGHVHAPLAVLPPPQVVMVPAPYQATAPLAVAANPAPVAAPPAHEVRSTEQHTGSANWQKVPSRQAHPQPQRLIQQQSYEQRELATSETLQREFPPAAAPAPGRLPTAITAWRAQSNFR